MKAWIIAFWLAIWGIIAAGAANAAEFRVYIDADNNTQTGCAIATPGGNFSGAEELLITTVDTVTYPPVVTGITRQTCIGDPPSLSAPVAVSSSSWPVGVGAGAGGYDVIETYFPGQPTEGFWRLGFSYQDASIGSDAILTAPGGRAIGFLFAQPAIPALGAGGLALLALLVGGAAFVGYRRSHSAPMLLAAMLMVLLMAPVWAAIGMVMDGQVGDWAGVGPLVTDPTGDAPPGSDVSAIYMKPDGGRVYFRADVKTASAPIAANDTYAVLAGGTLSIAATPNGLLSNDTLGGPPALMTYFGGGNAGASLNNVPGTTVNFGAGNSGSLTINADGGFSFTPATGFSGPFVVNYRLTNIVGSSDGQVTINVNQAPAVTSANATTFGVGSSGSFNVATSGFPGGASMALSQSGSLPAGVTFVDNHNGTATLAGTPNAGTVGSYPITITAANGIGSNFNQPFTLTVAKASSSNGVSAPGATSVFGQSVTFSATVSTSAGAGVSPPTGTVNFLDGGNPIASNVPLANGSASFATSALALGAHSITVVYSGDGNLNASTSPAFALTVNKGSTSGSVSSTLNPSTFGQSVTFNATVSPVAPASGTPTGTVNFMDGASPLASNVALVGGAASYSTSALGGGAHAITVVYNGDANFNGSTGTPLTQTVNLAGTTTSVSGAPNPSVFGQSVTLTATLAVSAPGTGTPTGSVTFKDGAATLGSATVVGGTTATLSLGALSAGTHSIAASYAGDGNFAGSTSAASGQTVNSSSTSTALASSSNPGVMGNSITFTATVSPVAPGAGAPSGTVSYYDGATLLGTATLAGGAAQFSTSGLGSGVHPMSAVYGGDANFSGSTSAPLSQTINVAPGPVADGYTVKHDATLTVPAASGVLANDDLGLPAASIVAASGLAACVNNTSCATAHGSVTFNMADGSFVYAPAADFAGTDTFSYSLQNAVGTNSATVTITVEDLLPVVDLNGSAAGIDYGPVAFTEGGGPVAIVDGAQLTVQDSDSSQIKSATATITNLLDDTAEVLNVTPSGTILPGDIDTATPGVLKITRTTSVADYQAVLRTLTYENTSANPTTTTRTITVTVNDRILDSNPAAQTTVTIAAVNTPPSINAPASALTPINTALTFSSGNGNAVSVGDPDANGADEAVTLTVTHGTISQLGSTAGLAVSGVGSASVALSGTIANLNAALNGLTFAPATGYSGTASLQIDVDDQGNTGSGGAKTASKTVTVTIDTPPSVNGIVPANGATAVALSPTITVTFSEAVTVAVGGFKLECPAGSAQGFTPSPAYGGNASSFALTPSAPLPQGTVCTVTVVAAQVSDSVGQHLASNYTSSFTTDVLPTVSSTVPSNGATAIQPASTITINFSEAVHATASAFTLACPVGVGKTFTSVPALPGDGSTFTLTPDVAMPGGTTCTVTVVAAQVTDVDGSQNMASNHAFSFAIGSPPTFTSANSTSFTALQAGSFSVTATGAPGGSSIALSASGSLPSGVTFTDNGNGTATLAGTPAAGTQGSYPLTFTAANGIVPNTTQNFTLTVLNTPPQLIASPTETFDTVGNVQFEFKAVKALAVGTFVSGNLISNFTDADGPNSLGAVPATNAATTNGGKVTIASNGEFVFTPKAGDAAAFDTFQYQITDGLDTVTRTATVNLKSRVWFVKNNAAGGGQGGSGDPFNTLASAQAASLAGDYIFVYGGDGTTTGMAAGIVLKANQKLWGEPYGLTVATTVNGITNPTLVAANAANRPKIDNTGAGSDAVGITNITGVEVRGFSIAANTNAIDVTASGAGAAGATIVDNIITAAGQQGIKVTAGGTGGTSATIQNNTVTSTGNGIDVRTTSGATSVDISTSSVTSNATGILVDGSGGGSTRISGFADNAIAGTNTGTGISVTTATFDTTAGGTFQTVSAGNTVIGASGNGVGGAGMTLASVSGDLSFTGLSIYADGGAGMLVSGTTGYTGSAGIRVAAPTGTVVAVGGPAVDFSTLSMNGISMTVQSTNSSTTGAAFNSVSGSFTGGVGSSISNSTTTGFQVGSSSATISYAGTVNTSAGKGVELTGNTGGTISFTGALTLSSAGNATFNATGGGTISSTNTASTLTSTTGTTLNVANTTIGAGGLKFQSISASGAANGIVLNNTGSSGGLTVLGNGGTCTSLASTCTGGTIQNTTGHAISLTSTQSPSFSNMKILNAARSGIFGTGVTNFTLASSVIDGVNTSHTTTDGNLAFNTNSGAATENNLSGTVSITNNTLNNSYVDGISIYNYAGTISNLTITGNSMTSNSSSASSIGSAILVYANKNNAGGNFASITTGAISNNTISNFPAGAGIQVMAGNSGSGPLGGNIGSLASPLVIQSNTITGAGPDASGMGTNGIAVTVGHQSDGFFTIGSSGNGNLITNVKGNGIACSKFGNNGTAGYTKCSIKNNTISAHNTANSPAINTGADMATASTNTPTLYLDIQSNSIPNTQGNGILSTIRNTDGNGVFNIVNNTVTQPTAASGTVYGIRADAGNGSESAGATVCLKISGNTTAGSTNGGTTAPGIGLRQNHTVGTVATFNIDGLAPNPAADGGQMEAYVNGLNPASVSGTFGVGGTASISSGATYHAATCTIP